jgi:hypothetical protein
MAKWKSPIFSDIRNKLGENVVFSMWKGRPYMRSYVTPSNPKTLGQTANRADMTRLVEAWQTEIAATPALVTAWNKAALSDLISGYNRFIKGFRGFVLNGAYTLAHATFTFTVDSTKLPVNEQQIYAVVAATSAVLPCDSSRLGAYTVADFGPFSPAAGDYFVVWDIKAAEGAAMTFATKDYFGAQLCAVNETTGAVVPIVLT